MSSRFEPFSRPASAGLLVYMMLLRMGITIPLNSGYQCPFSTGSAWRLGAGGARPTNLAINSARLFTP